MKVVNAPDSIDVEAVRVGMFVHLDVGWLSHPFPLSSFKVTSQEQVATIRSLGLKRVRWSPHQSDLPAMVGGLSSPEAASPDGAQPHPLPDAAGESPAAAPNDVEPAASAELPPESAFDLSANTSPEKAVRAEHKRRLAAEAAALALCERQFAEAARDCERLTHLVPTEPQQARAQAEALTQALRNKMLADQEINIRLLTDAAGNKAAMHALNVTIVSLLMGRAMGLAEPDMQDLGVGAMLHDIGKLDLPDRLRHREDQFSSVENRLYEEHVANGVTLARRMGLAPGAMLVVAQHHELADGSGFPLRLKTDRLTVASRIVALVNRYDNLCNPHTLGAAVTPHEALSLMFAHYKAKFDAAILAAFIKLMGVYPPGSTVQLSDDRFAMVVGVNSTRPLKPCVLVHEPTIAREEALLLDLEAAPGVSIRRSVGHRQLPRPARDYLSPAARVAYFFESTSGELRAG